MSKIIEIQTTDNRIKYILKARSKRNALKKIKEVYGSRFEDEIDTIEVVEEYITASEHSFKELQAGKIVGLIKCKVSHLLKKNE